MKVFSVAAIMAITATTATADTVIENEKMRSYGACVLRSGFTISDLRDKGAKITKIVDSTADQTFLYKVNLGGKTAFVACEGKTHKVWIMD